jgi:hypothetical protein
VDHFLTGLQWKSRPRVSSTISRSLV